jgi:2-dehydro-3-deoxyphosphogalactonate aldolase
MIGQTLWRRTLSSMPLIAILRGIQPAEVIDVAAALDEAGFLALEIPLNSPDPLTSIRRLHEHFGAKLLVGAGTVLTPADVEAVREAGAEFVVSPDSNPAVIRATKANGLVSIPGFATPSEAFAAIEAGADALKLFPAEAAPPPIMRAMRSVLPGAMPIFPVGGITPDSMFEYVTAGAAGFGIGSAVYKVGMDAATVRERAAKFTAAWRGLRTKQPMHSRRGHI